MVGHHIAERPGSLVVAAARLDADDLGRRDLDIVDIARVPNRLEDAVTEAEREQILHRLLTEVMIDAIDLLLLEDLLDFLVERDRRFEIVAKGFFDNHPPPAPALFADQARVAELLD